jgi:hypothetical protein
MEKNLHQLVCILSQNNLRLTLGISVFNRVIIKRLKCFSELLTELITCLPVTRQREASTLTHSYF